MMDRSRSWTWLWREVLPDFANRMETALGGPVIVRVDSASLDDLPDPRDRLSFLLDELSKAIQAAVTPQAEGVGALAEERERSARLAAERRDFLKERIQTIEIRAGQYPAEPILRLEHDTLRLTVPANSDVAQPGGAEGQTVSDFRSFPGCRAEDLRKWIEGSLDPEVMALLRKLQREDFPKARAYFQQRVTHLIDASSLGDDARAAMREIVSREGLALELDWQSFASIEDRDERIAALRRIETGASSHSHEHGDVFGALFHAIDETARTNPAFLPRFLQRVRTVLFKQSGLAHVELGSEGSTLVVSEGRHSIGGSWEELLHVLGPVVSAMLPGSEAGAVTQESIVEMRTNQLSKMLGKRVEIAVDPIFRCAPEAEDFLARQVLSTLVGTIRLLMDRPGLTELLQRDLSEIRVEPAEPGAKSECVYQDGALVIRCRVKHAGFGLLAPGDLMSSIDNVLSLQARSRIKQVERDNRDSWQDRLREAFGRDVKLDVDWDGFLAHPSEGGSRLYPLHVGDAGVQRLVRSLTRLMKQDAHFRECVTERVDVVRVASAPDISAKGLSVEGGAIVNRCFADMSLNGYLTDEEIEKDLYRLLARRVGEKLAYTREELPACLEAILEQESPYEGVCEVTSWSFEVSEAPVPLCREEDAVAVRVSYDYRRGDEVGSFTDFQLYRWFPGGELRRVFSRTIERTCEWSGDRYSLHGQVETSGRMGGPGLKHTRVYVSLKEQVLRGGESTGCESKEEHVWSDDNYVDSWQVFECRLSRDALLDLAGVARPLHSIVGHQVRARTWRGGIAAVVEAFGDRTLFLFRDEGAGWRLAGSGEIVSAESPADRFFRDPGRLRTSQMSEPYLYNEDRILDLGGLGLAIPLSCAYREGRAVQLYRCNNGRLEQVFFYNLEHRWDGGKYAAKVSPIEGEREGIPHLEVRGTLTRYSGTRAAPSDISFVRVFGWNGRRYVPLTSHDKGLPFGRNRLAAFSAEDVLRSIYGTHLAIMSEIGSPDGVLVKRFGNSYAILVVAKRQLFVLREEEGDLRTVAGAELSQVEYLEEAPSVRERKITFSHGDWRVSKSNSVIAVECTLGLAVEFAKTPLKGRARWIFLFLHRPEEGSLELILESPIERRLFRATGHPALRLLGWLGAGRFEHWRGRLELASGSQEGDYRPMRLVSRGRGEGRIFFWNGRRYVDSTRIARIADDIARELQRLQLWREDADRVPAGLEATTSDDFPIWLQLVLVPALRTLSGEHRPPDIRGLSDIAEDRLSDRRTAGLRSILAKLEAELHGTVTPGVR